MTDVVLCGWEELAPSTTPAGRYLHALAYDALNEKVAMFGGYDGARRGDTVTHDGIDWTVLSPATSPAARAAHAMAWDGDNNNIVLFGGDKSGSPHNDETWIWDGTTWTQQFPSTTPPGRNGHAMIWEPTGPRVWMFGGAGASGPLNDLWAWDGFDWSDETPGTSPVARTGHGLAYDPTRGVIALYGGLGGATFDVNLDDTWTLSGGIWTQQTPVDTPARNDDGNRAADFGRFFYSVAFDVEADVTLIFGGAQLGLTRVRLSDTQTWDGTNWDDLGIAGPSMREWPAMVYDEARGWVLLFGGQDAGYYDDTWIFNCPAPADVATLRHTFGLS